MDADHLTERDVAAFGRDGVVCLRAAFSATWIEHLRAGFERNLSQPSDRASIFYDDGAGFLGVRDEETRGPYTGRDDLLAVPRFMNDIDNWREIPEYEAFRSAHPRRPSPAG